MLSQTAAYAIRALAYLAGKKGQAAYIKEISDAMNIPASYLAKIIHTLGRKHLVVTQRGIGGGISLAREPFSISLYDICEALDEPLLENRCILGLPNCSGDTNPCPLHNFWREQKEREIAFLHKQSIADVAKIMEEKREKTEEEGFWLQRR